MKIGIVLHPYGENKPAGLARTIFELTKGLLEVDQKNEYIIYLKEEPKSTPDLPGKNWKVEVLGGGIFWLDNLRGALKSDVYIFNTPILPLFYKVPRSIVIALDFAYQFIPPESLKQRIYNFFIKKYNGYSLRKADTLVAISEATKKDVMEIYGISASRIHVIYLGLNSIFNNVPKPIELPQKFFLSVGVIKERKNLLSTIKGFNLYKKEGGLAKLVVVGKGEGSYREKINSYIREQNLVSDVLFLNFVTDNELAFIYKAALAFVFPSRIEGFGLPVLEAMSLSLPVITSTVSSLAEVAGDAALLVDPLSEEAIARAMKQIDHDTILRENLIAKGKKRIELFSWHKAAMEFLKII